MIENPTSTTQEIYARSANAEGEKETLEHHLRRASELCGEFLKPVGMEEAGKAIGVLHDFGKSGERFQKVLKGEEHRINHAAPGALIAGGYVVGKDIRPIQAAIASHHGELSYIIPSNEILLETNDKKDSDGKRYSLFGHDEYATAINYFNKIVPPNSYHVTFPAFDHSVDGATEMMLLYRMLFSALTDADFSSSAEHFEPDYLATHTGSPLDCGSAYQNLQRLIQAKKSGSTANAALNMMRDELANNCEQAAEGEPGLYSLTAPTGLGKTMALMKFAIAHAEKHGMRRIILVAPYLSIIDQNVKDYKSIIPDLLESHGNAHLSEESRLLAERWAASCIVTTNVGFLEPLFSDERADVRHLHEIAKSVIVLDEAQSLPTDLIYATLTTLKELCKTYGCTVVLSTATQPRYDWLPNLSWEPEEIVSNPQQLFDATRRVEYEWRIGMGKQMPFERIADEMSGAEQILTIVNMRAHARKIVSLLKERVGEDGTYFISSDLCTAHREHIVAEIKERLRSGLPCRVVSTQCVEAGVDLDFPVVYRALAPLESIIQAAGRCNRNASIEKGRVVVFIPEEEKYPHGDGYYGNAASMVKVLASRHPEGIDCNDLNQINEYYRLVFQLVDGDKKCLREAIKASDFQEAKKAYKLINSDGMAQVIVPYSACLTKDGDSLYEKIKEEYDKSGLTTQIMAMARPITVSTYNTALLQKCAERMRFKKYGEDTDNTGFWRMVDDRYYDSITGLSEPGEPIINIY